MSKVTMAPKKQGTEDAPKKVKKEYKKRSWSGDEEKVLLSAIKGLVASGWKSDNGFRANYMAHLEDAMRNAFPQTDLRGRPHIESKLTAWKKTYSALRDILGRSGVGFNLEGDFKIDCDDVLWEEICRSDTSIANWRNKKWPYYEDWKIVFGKDRANGEGAAEISEMFHDMPEVAEGPSQKHVNTVTRPIDLDDGLVGDSAADDSVAQSRYAGGRNNKGNKKRPFEDNIGTLVELVGEMTKINKAKFEVVNSSVAKATKPDVWSLMKNIQGFTRGQLFRATEKLLKSPECLELFMGLSEDDRAEYVEHMLELDSSH